MSFTRLLPKNMGNCFNSKCGLIGSSARGPVMTWGWAGGLGGRLKAEGYRYSYSRFTSSYGGNYQQCKAVTLQFKRTC